MYGSRKILQKLLSCSFDSTIKIHGLKSNKALKIFRGHSSFINSVQFSRDEGLVVSGSSDGLVMLWNTATTECVKTIRLGNGKVNAKDGSLKRLGSFF